MDVTQRLRDRAQIEVVRGIAMFALALGLFAFIGTGDIAEALHYMLLSAGSAVFLIAIGSMFVRRL